MRGNAQCRRPRSSITQKNAASIKSAQPVLYTAHEGVQRLLTIGHRVRSKRTPAPRPPNPAIASPVSFAIGGFWAPKDTPRLQPDNIVTLEGGKFTVVVVLAWQGSVFA